MIATTQLQMDIGATGGTYRVHVKQGDANSRALKLSLYENGSLWIIPETARPVIRYQRPYDGSGGIYDTLEDGCSAWSISGNEIQVILAPQMLAQSGAILMDIALTDGNAMLATWNINVYVEYSPQEGAEIEQEDYFNLAKVTTAYDTLHQAIDQAGAEISALSAASLLEIEGAKAEAVAAVPDVVNTWLDAHPEATTTVQDGAITPEKTSFIGYNEIRGEDTVTPNFTNQIPISTDASGNVIGLVANTYISSSSGSTSAKTGYATTGFIPITGSTSADIIRFDSAGFSSTDSYCRIGFYDANKAFIAATNGSGMTGDSAFTGRYTLDGSGNYITLDLSAKNNYFIANKGATPQYVRICSPGFTDASAISVNEEISYTTTPGEITLTNLILDESILVPQAETNRESIAGLAQSAESLDQRVQTLEEDIVPDYVRAEAERVAEVVRSHQNAGTFSFLVMSDFHQTEASAQITAGNRHAGQAAALLRRMIHLDFAAALGDYTWGSSTTTIEGGISEIQQVNEWIAEGFRGIPNFRTIGNHDILTLSWEQNGDYLTNAELWPLVGVYNADAVLPDTDRSRTMCYRDFDNYKLRVIMLNTTDENGQTVTATNKASMHIHGIQAKWLASALNLSDKADAAQWGIVLLSHYPLDWGRNMELVPMLKALIDGTAGSLTRDSQSVSWDFTGENRAHFIAQFHGHVHGFKVDNIHSDSETTIDLKRIAIPNACFRRSNEYGQNDATESSGIEFGETTTYTKTENTAQDTAFCVVTMDTANRIIYADHYGAGYDRVIEY